MLILSNQFFRLSDNPLQIKEKHLLLFYFRVLNYNEKTSSSDTKVKSMNHYILKFVIFVKFHCSHTKVGIFLNNNIKERKKPRDDIVEKYQDRKKKRHRK
jgi:hypothetical protein